MDRNRRPRFASRNRPNSILSKTLRTVLESLEERVLLASSPIITEFVAQNTNGLVDNFGQTSDWLEIYNPNSTPLDLGGYFLTDDVNNPNLWQIPAGQTLGGNGYLVVFATGRDISIPNQPLHTNFQISSGGGYLALVAPDGTTAVSSYDYPEQLANTSYGIAVQSTANKYLGTGAIVKSFVPANGNLGTTWTTNTFNDSSWRQGVTGVGYETDPLPPPTTQWAVRMVNTVAGPMGTIADATNVLNGTGSGYTITTDKSTNYPQVNLAGGGNFTGDYILPNGETNVDAAGRSFYALRATASVTIPVGTWTLAVGSDDGFRLRIPGVTFTSRINENFTGAPNPSPADTLVYGAGRGHATTSATITITGSPLVTTLQLDSFEGQGGDDLELSAAVGLKTSFNTTDFSLLANGWNGWSVSSPNVTPQQNYRPLIGNNQDLQATMFNVNSSAYMRMPFTIGDPSQTDTLLLRMKYDDGFVAYINGVKVAERNAPASPVWNSVATQEHLDPQALVFEDIVIPISAGLLVAGTNTLAIQGLNKTANDADFIILPTLDGLDTITLPGDRYMSTPTPGSLNNTSNINGVVGDTHFSVDRGFYSSPFPLVITTDTPGAEIRYTLNGSAPSATSTLYTGPITIDKTTTLRAQAFKTGLTSSGVDTESYIFLDDVIKQTAAAPNVGGTQWPSGTVNGQTLNYGMKTGVINVAPWKDEIKNDLLAIPTINIGIDVNDMFGATTGIYTHASNDGRAWERPASIELINPDGTPGFQVNAGIRIRGGFSSSGSNPKHALRLFFRSEYGDSKLKYPLSGTCSEYLAANPWAPGPEVCPTDEFDSVDLRTFNNYSWSFGGDPSGIFIQDSLSRDMQLAQGEESSHGKMYHLYIDGQYWGIYNVDERPEAAFSASYFGGEKEDYDAVKPDCGGCNIIATDGDLNAWTQLYNLAASMGKITIPYSSKTGAPLVGQTVTQLNSNATGVISSIDGATGVLTITINTGFFTNKAADLIRVNATNFVTPDPTIPIVDPSNDIYYKMQGLNPDGTRNPNYPILLDMDNLIDYMLVILYGGNLDAPITNFGSNNVQNNWFGTRPKDGSNGFRFFAHDSEHTILPSNPASTDRTGPWPNPATANNPWTLEQSNPQYIWQQLGGARNDAGSSEFRLRVADHIRAQFFDNGPLTTAQVLLRFDARKNELINAVVGESARWGNSSLTKNTWLNAVANARNYLLTRSNAIFNQLVADGQYPKTTAGATFNAPVFNQYGGNIGNGFNLLITNPNGFGGTIYYTLDGADPRTAGGAISPNAIAYTGTIPLNTSLQAKARIRFVDGAIVRWSPITSAKFKYNLSGLHVTEVNYNPAPPPVGSPYTADDFEYIEFQNTGNQTLQLGGIKFDQGITFTFPTMSLAGGARTLVVKNRAAFESRYGLGLPIAGEYIGAAGGTLSNTSEDINIRGPVNEQLLHFNYDADWYPITNGGGYSLVVRDPNAGQLPTPQDPTNPLSHSSSWRPSNLVGGAPGDADPGINPEAVVINEATSNSSAPSGDWIELKNTTNASMDIGGWFLSNDALNLKKYQIPAGTVLPAGGFIVFNQQSNFGVAGNPGVAVPFTLDEVLGADIYLTNNDGSNNPAGYREHADFSASPIDVSFGRYIKSTGASDFTQLVSPTPLANNSGPVIGPIVISEVNYNPTAGDSEFIELENITETAVPLWDPANPNNTWKMITGVDFTFPTNTSIPGFSSVILIPQSISIAAFRTQFSVPPEVQIFQYAGALDNGGEDLKLARPMAPVGATVPYVLADKLKYGDSAPWPIVPDGNGPTLQRLVPTNYGNDPANWKTGPNHGNPGVVTAPQRPPVVNAGADGSVIAGVQFSSSGSFTDINNDQTWTGSVNWGDGNTTPLTVNPNKTFNLNHTFINPGDYTVTITITDSYPENATDTIQVHVNPSTPPSVNAGPDVEVVQADGFATGGSFTDPDIGQSWTATVDWSDGNGSFPITLHADKTFNLNHTYISPGDYTVTISVKDNANLISTDTFIAHVVANTVPTVLGGADQAVPEGTDIITSGSFTDPNPSQTWSATVNYGDGSPTGPLALNADKTYNLDHLYPGPGSYTITITVTDSIGGAGVDTVIASVTPGPRLGTADNDTYILRRDPTGNNVEFYENRTIAQGPNYSILYGAMDNYIFNGVGGNDTLIIDLSNGNPIPTGGINYNGGTQVAPGDLVQITGSGGNDEIHITASQVIIGSAALDYSGIERINIDGGAGDDSMVIDEAPAFTPTFNGGTGTDSIVLNAGIYRFTTDAGLTSSKLNLVGNTDTTFIATATQHLNSLTLNDNARFTVGTNGSRVISLAALSMGPAAILDLFDNDLLLQPTAVNRQDMLDLITNLLRSGRNGGAWNGPGIRSTTAANNAAHTTGLAGILNDHGDGTPVQNTFAGETVNANSILVKYTYNGDANVDGVLNADDYAQIDAGFASQAIGYLNGDFNYSGGAPNSDDYFLIDKTFADQGAPLGGAAAPLAATAEETSAAEPLTRTKVQSVRKHQVKHPHKTRHHHARPAMHLLLPWTRR
jgi:hypothetical protein